MIKNKSPKRVSRPKPLRLTFLTVFPHIFDSYLKESLLAKAQNKKVLDVRVVNLRDYARGKHASTDDRPFGGGPGMVLKLEPIYDALRTILKKKTSKTRIILLSTRGPVFTQTAARRLSSYDHLLFICGRYEGVDERVAEHLADEELSIGEYVLAGGELPALVVAEAVARLRRGFMHTYESLEDVKGSYPAYTRPEAFRRPDMRHPWTVPPVLLSGDHHKIAAWRNQFKHTKPLPRRRRSGHASPS